MPLEQQRFINVTTLHLSLRFLQEPQQVWRVIRRDLRWPPSLAPQPGTKKRDNAQQRQNKLVYTNGYENTAWNA